MALGATVYKATIDVSDLDRDSYGNYVLTIARHPSETEERLMLRVLAFAGWRANVWSSAADFQRKANPRSGRLTTRGRSSSGSRWDVPTSSR